MNLINGAMDLDPLEQGVSQHYNVDRSGELECGSGGGGGGDGAAGDAGAEEMVWSQIVLLRFSYSEKPETAACCCWQWYWY